MSEEITDSERKRIIELAEESFNKYDSDTQWAICDGYEDGFLDGYLTCSERTSEAHGEVSPLNWRVRPRLFSLGRIKVGFGMSRSTEDPEKLLTPGILYCKKQDEDTAIRVHLFAAGIWDLSLNMYVAVLPQKQTSAA